VVDLLSYCWFTNETTHCDEYQPEFDRQIEHDHHFKHDLDDRAFESSAT